jgi:hypothetical protein
MSGPWEDYAKPQESAPEEGPWADYAPKPKRAAPSMGESLVDGLVSAARTVDSYTGAPVRAGIGALQDGKGTIGALKAAGSQFGEDPESAPTGKDIRTKAGLDLGDKSLDDVRIPGIDMTLGEIIKTHPAIKYHPVNRAVYGKLTEASPNDAAEFAIEAGADLTNIVPVGAIAKGVAKGGAKLASGVVNAASDAVAATGRGAARVGKRVVQGAFGIPEESITRYIARHPQLKDKVGAKEMMEELAGRLDEGLKPARAELQAAEEAVARAKQSRSEDLAELQIKRQEAAEMLRRAEDEALGEAASRLSTRVQQLDESTRAGSTKAYEILDSEGVSVPTQQLKARMTAGIKALEERAVTDEQVKVVELLTRYRERLDKFGPEIPGGEAKRILQSLDREMSFVAPGEIGRMSKPDQALGALRRHIDEPLKKSDAYAAQMKEVSDTMKLLESVKGLSSDSAAARALKAARGATGADKAEAIRQVASRFGDDFLAAADRRNLPEYHKLKALLQRLRATKKGQGVKDAEAALEATRSKVGDAVGLGKDGVAGITDKINATVRRSEPGALQVENLSRAGDVAGVSDMGDELADIRTVASFEKGYNRGSANTNFWAAVAGGVVGSIFGPAGMAGGAALGAGTGRLLIDNFGPKVGRVILDQVPLLQKLEPAEWIRRLDVPADVKVKLGEDLAAYRQISRGTRGTAALSKTAGETARKVAEEEGPNRSPSEFRGEERWARTGLQKLGISGARAEALLKDKNSRRLLIEASDLPPGSKALQRIQDQIQKGRQQ